MYAVSSRLPSRWTSSAGMCGCSSDGKSAGTYGLAMDSSCASLLGGGDMRHSTTAVEKKEGGGGGAFAPKSLHGMRTADHRFIGAVDDAAHALDRVCLKTTVNGNTNGATRHRRAPLKDVRVAVPCAVRFGSPAALAADGDRNKLAGRALPPPGKLKNVVQALLRTTLSSDSDTCSHRSSCRARSCSVSWLSSVLGTL